MKQFLFKDLTDCQRKSTSILLSSGNGRPFSVIRRSVLRQNNFLLKKRESSSPGYGLKTDFSKGESGSRLFGLYTKTGLLGMLETKNFDSPDMVSPLIKAIADRSGGNVKSAPVTKVFTKYCDILPTICRQGLRIGWTESEQHSLSKSIKNFEDHAQSVFKHYQVSGEGTFKWHCLDHHEGSLKNVGDMKYLHADH